MKKIPLPKTDRLMFRSRPDYDSPKNPGPRYQRLRRSLPITMFLLTLVPLSLTSLLCIIGYREVL